MLLAVVAFGGPVHAQSKEVAEGIVSRIEAEETDIKKTEPIKIRAMFTNTTDKQVNLPTWGTPIEGFNANIFMVTRDGVSITDSGRVVKRGLSLVDDYVSIESW